MTPFEVAVFVALICAGPTVMVFALRSGGATLTALEKDSPWWKPRRWKTGHGGRTLRVWTKTAMQDIYACIGVPLTYPLPDKLELGALEAFGFTSLTLTHHTLTYTGSDRWRMLHDPSLNTNALDSGPRPSGDGRIVHLRYEDDHLALGFKQVTNERLPGILQAMSALADAIEGELERPWTELADRYGLEGGYGLLMGTIDGFAVEVRTDSTRFTHGLDLPEDLEVAHKDELEGEGLGDPVLDLCLRTTGRIEVPEEAVEPLLEVLHGRRGSRLDASHLHVVGHDPRAVEAGLQLLRALR